LGAAATQKQIQMLTFESRFCDRVLRDHTAIVFNFNIQPVIWQNAFAELQDFCESIGPESVFRIGPDMCLQQHLFFFAGFATAIDKHSHDVTNFGYVRVSRDMIAVRQYKTWKRRWVLADEIFQSV
jgi:hypothetical protein